MLWIYQWFIFKNGINHLKTRVKRNFYLVFENNNLFD